MTQGACLVSWKWEGLTKGKTKRRATSPNKNKGISRKVEPMCIIKRAKKGKCEEEKKKKQKTPGKQKGLLRKSGDAQYEAVSLSSPRNPFERKVTREGKKPGSSGRGKKKVNGGTRS